MTIDLINHSYLMRPLFKKLKEQSYLKGQRASGLMNMEVTKDSMSRGNMGTPYTFLDATAAAKSLQLCPTPCDPMNCSPLSSSVRGVFQARILEHISYLPLAYLPFPTPEDLPNSKIEPPVSCISCIGRPILYH